VPLAGAFYAVLALLAWGWRTGLGGQPLLTSTGPPGSVSLAWALALGVLAGLGVVVLSRVATLRTRAGRQLAATLAQSLPTLSRRDVVLLALASGVCEELFFRGAVQPSLGLGAASLLFALAHLIPRWPLVLWSVFALAAGLLFGLLYEHTGSVLAPAVAHVIVNGLNLGWLERRRGSL
jgi:membrane protease YdiL (CAAX protease family)